MGKVGKALKAGKLMICQTTNYAGSTTTQSLNSILLPAPGMF
jgi:hypothetical protein